MAKLYGNEEPGVFKSKNPRTEKNDSKSNAVNERTWFSTYLTHESVQDEQGKAPRWIAYSQE